MLPFLIVGTSVWINDTCFVFVDRMIFYIVYHDVIMAASNSVKFGVLYAMITL